VAPSDTSATELGLPDNHDVAQKRIQPLRSPEGLLYLRRGAPVAFGQSNRRAPPYEHPCPRPQSSEYDCGVNKKTAGRQSDRCDIQCSGPMSWGVSLNV
jgi:hypothetical protein